jgi:hypothetical protein
MSETQRHGRPHQKSESQPDSASGCVTQTGARTLLQCTDEDGAKAALDVSTVSLRIEDDESEKDHNTNSNREASRPSESSPTRASNPDTDKSRNSGELKKSDKLKSSTTADLQTANVGSALTEDSGDVIEESDSAALTEASGWRTFLKSITRNWFDNLLMLVLWTYLPDTINFISINAWTADKWIGGGDGGGVGSTVI